MLNMTREEEREKEKKRIFAKVSRGVLIRWENSAIVEATGLASVLLMRV